MTHTPRSLQPLTPAMWQKGSLHERGAVRTMQITRRLNMTTELRAVLDAMTLPERVKVSKGEHCPMCKSKNVKCVGSSPDGRNMNYAYDCQDCPAKWEGF